MLPITWYLLKVIACSAILYGYYYIALRNNIFNRYNRFYLLMVVILSPIVPLLKINIWGSANSKLPVMHLIQFISSGDEFVYNHSNDGYWHLDFATVAIGIYSLICAVLSMHIIQTFMKIERLKEQFPSSLLGAINFRNTNAKGTPFSFFNNIFWNEEIDIHTSTGKQILQHEITHVKEKHSHDKLIINIILVFFWANPFFWIIRKELNLIHEFIADNKAVADKDSATFVAMILKATYPQQQFILTNNFFYSPLKRRIIMLTKNRNPKINYISRLLVLPLTAIVFLAFTLKVNHAVSGNIYNGKTLTVVIDPGHGGEDAGAKANGLTEKEITLLVAKKVKESNSNTHLHIVLARDNDQSLTPQQRMNYANSLHADLFISLHLNANPNDFTNSGLQVLIPGNDNSYFQQSSLLGSSMLESFKTGYQLKVDNTLLQRGKGVWVLRSNTCPAILLELAFLTSAADAAYMSNASNIDRIAKNIISGIENYASAEPAKIILPILSVPDSIPVPYNKKHADPLIIVDGVEKGRDKKVLSSIESHKIVSVNVLKNEMAITKYGDKGKFGVIEIFTKTVTTKDTTTDYPETQSSTSSVNKETASGRIEISNDQSKNKRIFTRTEHPAEFPGGEKAWVEYLMHCINKNLVALNKSGVDGTCTIKFIVEEDGSVGDVQALTLKGTKLAEVVTEAITKGPKWVPATQNGHIVTSYKELPVTYRKN